MYVFERLRQYILAAIMSNKKYDYGKNEKKTSPKLFPIPLVLVFFSPFFSSWTNTKVEDKQASKQANTHKNHK